MSEKELQKAVLELAKRLRWRHYHPLPAQHRDGSWATATMGDTGFPDAILAKGRRLLAVEFKGARGRLGPGQQEWLDAIAATGNEAYLWRPRDLETGFIERCLKGAA